MSTGGNDTLFFDGLVSQMTVTLVNPYTGETVSIDEQKNINRGVYDGLGGVDTLLMTNFGDALLLRDDLGNQVVTSVETFIAGDGGDVIALADATILYGSVMMFGGQGDDILWSNIGDDTIFAGAGNDMINGGGGNDILNGENDDDNIRGGDGNDTINGGDGNDTVRGGNGADNIIYVGGNDTVIEVADGAMDIITMSKGITLADLSFTDSGDDLIVTINGLGSITITGQYIPDAGIDRIVFNDNSFVDLPRGHAPVALDDNFSNDEDGIVSGNVLGNDSDQNSFDVLSVVPLSFITVNGGIVELLADGSLTYTPAANFFGSETFDYTLLDGHGNSDTGTVTITIASVNDAPVANDDDFVGNEDLDVSGNVLGNDSDVDGGILSVVAATLTTINNGFVTVHADGSFTYTPALNFFGSDSFDYTLLDGQSGSDIATVNIIVNSINDNPVATDDSFSGAEDVVVSGNVLGNDSDVDGVTFSVVAATLTTVHGGTVELLADGSFTYTPAADFNGIDTFDYTLLDGQGGNDSGSVEIIIGSINDGPVAQDDTFSGDEDTNISGNVLTNDSDSDGGILNVVVATIVTLHNGTVTLLANGDFTYVPAANYYGADSFNYTLVDGQGGSDIGTVNLSIDSINDGPVAGNDTFTGNEDGVITGNLLGNDSDIDGGVLSITAGVFVTAHGTVTVLANGDFTYTPDADYFGADSFDYTLVDGQGGSDTGLVSLMLNDVPDGSIITGTNGHDTIHGTAADDHIEGLDGKDTIYGHMGNDHIVGGNHNDTLYGGSNTAHIILDKDIHDPILFPNVKEGKDIKTLKPPGTPALGIYGDNLTVDFEASATITFRKGFAGYDNTFGMYRVGADGTIEAAQVLWANVKTAGVDIAHTIDLPVGSEGGEYGFFIIADGNNTNHGYTGLDITGDGNISFIYDFGLVTERAATVNDAGSRVSVVYDDGVTTRLLQGYDYHTTGRGDAPSLNHDGKVHVISGMVDNDNSDVLRIGFEDLPALGDADYEDVLFDIDINEVHIDVSEQGNDVLIGGAGNDALYGEAGDDILVGGDGNDKLYGGDGSDQFIFNSINDKTDDIYGFETGVGGDAVNITDVLDGYDALSDAISDFVRLVQYGNSTKLQVNVDGAGNDFKTLAVFDAIITDSVQTLVSNGNLVLDQHVNV